MRYIIVGGVAAGASFACRLRRLDEFAEIIIYEKTNFVSYANCGLPYYISSVIDDKSKLTLQTPASLKARFNIDVYVSHEVISVEKEEKRVKVKNLINDEEFYDNYDRLILAPGSEAIKLTNNSRRIHELKTVEDSIKIKDIINKLNVKKATIIGGGFIGLEIAENLVHAGIKVTLIEGKSHVLANFDSEMASFIHHELRKNGVRLLLNKMVKEVNEDDNKVIIKLENEMIVSDLLIQAIGVKPNSSLAKNANLDLDIRGTIKINENYKTNDESIYALGDVIALDSLIDNSRVSIPLAGFANREGRELASYFLLNKKNDIKALGTSILKVFNLSAASTGFNEEQLINKKIPYEKIYLCPTNHASYYPGSTILNIKVLFNKTDYKILGAQIVGEEGVDKRIDVLAMAIKGNMIVYDLANAELSYAPPFGSAKDPINMIGFIAENLKNGLVDQFYFEEIETLQKDSNNLFIDVRSENEYKEGHIPNFINIPLDELRAKLDLIDKNKNIYLNCQSALRSYIALRILVQRGYKCKHLAGGYRIFQSFFEDQEFIKNQK